MQQTFHAVLTIFSAVQYVEIQLNSNRKVCINKIEHCFMHRSNDIKMLVTPCMSYTVISNKTTDDKFSKGTPLEHSRVMILPLASKLKLRPIAVITPAAIQRKIKAAIKFLRL